MLAGLVAGLALWALCRVGSASAGDSDALSARASDGDAVSALIAEANDCYHAGRYGRAARLADRAAALDPAGEEATLLAALAHYELGDAEVARRLFQQALTLSLEDQDRALARTYLELLDLGSDEQSPWSHHLRAGLGGGFDSNVRLAPLLEETGAIAADPSPRQGAFVSASLFAGVGHRRGAALFELEYGLLQTAYPAALLDGSSFQMHLLEWSTELWLGRSLRLRLPVRGEVSLLGLRGGVRPFEWSAGVDPEVTVVLGRHLRLAVGAALAEQHPLDPALAVLEGATRQLSAGLSLAASGWTGSLLGRYRDENLGSSRDPAASSATTVTAAGDACPACQGWVTSSYSYQALGLSARVAGPSGKRLRPALTAAAEDRRYAPRSTEMTLMDGGMAQANLAARHDVRATLGASLTVRLDDTWQLTARYELVQNRSTFTGGSSEVCGRPGACLLVSQRDYNYRKHTLALELEAEWN